MMSMCKIRDMEELNTFKKFQSFDMTRVWYKNKVIGGALINEDKSLITKYLLCYRLCVQSVSNGELLEFI